ncbi:hypothetical protein ACHAQA_005218 [Verticillium albo-atrum]
MRSLLINALVIASATPPIVASLISSTEHVSSLSHLPHLQGKDSVSGPFNFSVPVDHFHNETRYEPHTNDTFPLRYWINKKHYRPGGPVFLLAAGETTAADRLGFLDHGIIAQFSRATNGLGVVLEHRYYGTSFPVANLSIQNMRFLSTEQALADTAFFAEHVSFPELEDEELAPTDVPWIAFGGSYAGAFVAFLRKVYPDVFWGAISSSGVTEAIVDYWEYFEAARLFAPGDCAEVTARLTGIVDNILTLQGDATENDRQALKSAFGLEKLEHDDDVATVLSQGISQLQGQNWDPALDSSAFGLYCGSLSSNDVLFASTRHLDKTAQKLLRAGGASELHVKELTVKLLNFIGYVRQDVKSSCNGGHLNECYAARGNERWQRTNLNQGWERSWTWQVCTEWGYFQTGSGAPSTQQSLVSRLIDLNYTSIPCREAFNITTLPDVDRINKHGGFGITYPRLAIVDGEADPWRAATPHRIGLPDRKSTTEEPFLLMGGGAVHHWDENGVAEEGLEGYEESLPPHDVKRVQQAELEFVQAWVDAWHEAKSDQTNEVLSLDL